jgi:hypothetical protein
VKRSAWGLAVAVLAAGCGFYGDPFTQVAVQNNDDQRYVIRYAAEPEVGTWELPASSKQDSPVILDVGNDWKGTLELVNRDTCHVVDTFDITTDRTLVHVKDGAVASVEPGADLSNIPPLEARFADRCAFD